MSLLHQRTVLMLVKTFLTLLMHIVAATFKKLKMTAVSDTPILSDNICQMMSGRMCFISYAKILLIHLYHWILAQSTVSITEDSVFSYACQLLSLGLLYHEFLDSR